MRRLIKTILGQDFDLDVRGLSLIERLCRALSRSVLRKRQKVFCIGMQKTGTTSLGQALKFLGYRVNKWNAGRWSLRSENCPDWLASLVQYDAVEDEPAALLWRELEKEYPDSLFILTTRNDGDWLESAKRFYAEYAGRRTKVPTNDRQKSLAFRNFIYDGYGDPKMYPEEWLKRKQCHENDVLEYFENSGRLLVMNLDDGFTWKPLCEFLGVSVPRGLYASLNRLKS